MPNVALFDMAGNQKGEIELSEAVFGQQVNQPVLHSVVRAYLLNQRQGTQSTKTRAQVSGGGKRPWKQKGTGRARHGSTRSPQWTHGGVAFGPKPRSWKIEINKKVKRTAMKSALSAKISDGDLIVVDNISTGEYKTKKITDMLAALGADRKALIVLSSPDKFTVGSAANIKGVKTAFVEIRKTDEKTESSATLNVYDILKYDKLIVAQEAIGNIEEVYA